MKKFAGPFIGAALAIGLGACGPAGTAAAVKPSPSPSPRVRSGAAGELVKISPGELILSSALGDVTVGYTDATVFQRASTGTLADVTVGKCVVITGQKDGTGALIASGVGLTSPVAGACPPPGFGGGRLNPDGTPRSPRPLPSGSPRPAANLAVVAGIVTAVNGTTISVRDAAGAAQSVTVPTTVRVLRTTAAAASDLALHQCLQAQGQRDAAGRVSARSITIVPPSASGCTFGGGGFGRPGGGGRGNGSGGPPGPALGAGPPPAD
ncbi:MAG: DUF5666 domain-containing protein [Candidatus Dormibacteria bacterium]